MKSFFSKYRSILTFIFNTIYGPFLDFWCLNRLFLGVRVKFNNCFGAAHLAEQPLFYMFPSIQTFHFDLILGLFLFFGALAYCFGNLGRVKKPFLGLLK